MGLPEFRLSNRGAKSMNADANQNDDTEPVAASKVRYLDSIRGADLVVCPGCGAVLSLDNIERPESREVETAPARFLKSAETETITGVFCRIPGCDQLLFGPDEWQHHVVHR